MTKTTTQFAEEFNEKIDNFNKELIDNLIKLLKKYHLSGSLAGNYSLYEVINRESNKMKRKKCVDCQKYRLPMGKSMFDDKWRCMTCGNKHWNKSIKNKKR